MNDLKCKDDISGGCNPEHVKINALTAPSGDWIFDRENCDLRDSVRKENGKIFVQSAPVHDDRNYRLKDRLRDP